MNKGLIKISDSIYKDDWDMVCRIFKDFRPTHIEFRHWENNVWYFYGESKLFDEVKEGDIPFQYDIIFTSHPDGSYTYKFENYYKEAR